MKQFAHKTPSRPFQVTNEKASAPKTAPAPMWNGERARASLVLLLEIEPLVGVALRAR